MARTPLTNLLHSGSVQVGTGVSCMGRRRGSTEFTAVRSLPWPLGLAMGVGVFFAIRRSVRSPLTQQSSPLALGFYQGINAALVPIAGMVLCMRCFAVFAPRVGSYKRPKLLDTRTKLESLAANSCSHSNCTWTMLSSVKALRWKKPAWAVSTAASI